MEIDTSTPPPKTNRSPGRPRGFDADRVLEKALELFWTRGYRTTTTRELETALGLSQSSIYNAFGSKQDLLEAAMDRYRALTERELLQPLERSRAGLTALDKFFVGLAHFVTHKGRRGCMLVNMMAEDGGATAAITHRTNAFRGRVRAALWACLAQAAKLGEIKDELLEHRADLLMGLVLGLNIAARGGAPEAEMNRLLDAVLAQVHGWRMAPQ